MTEPQQIYAAGWYADVNAPGTERWYDGSSWTANVRQAPPTVVGTPTLHVVAQPARTSGKAIATLVFGIMGWVLVAVPLGIFALREIDRAQPAGSVTGRNLAIIGMVVSGIMSLIVFSIMMAVAVPTFLKQKENAGGAMARANVGQVLNAVESCAAERTDGLYTGCDGAALATAEPSLQPYLERGCTQPRGVCVRITPDGRGYSVGATTPTTPIATFTETHDADGNITRACAPTGSPVCTSPAR